MPMSGLAVLEAGHAGGVDLALVALLAVAGLGSAAVLALALAALLRRRSRSYLLVALALSALVARTAVASIAMAGGLAAGTHHALEHGLDVVMAALVIAAVYDARSTRRADAGSPDDPRGEGADR